MNDSEKLAYAKGVIAALIENIRTDGRKLHVDILEFNLNTATKILQSLLEKIDRFQEKV